MRKGAKFSKEHKQKLSIAHKKHWKLLSSQQKKQEIIRLRKISKKGTAAIRLMSVGKRWETNEKISKKISAWWDNMSSKRKSQQGRLSSKGQDNPYCKARQREVGS